MLQNKTLFITGGTSALGEALVKKALQNKASVYFTYHENKSKKLELENLGAIAIRCDLSNKASITKCLENFSKKVGHLDILINNAAIVRDHTIRNLTEEDWDEVIQINLKAPIQLTYGLLPIMNDSSKILNIISRAGIIGGFGDANYCASKDGLIEFTKYTAHEFSEKKVIVNALNPGFMISGMTKDLPQKIIDQNRNKSLLQHISDPNEVAHFVMHLLSDEVTKVTGHVFHYDSRSLP